MINSFSSSHHRIATSEDSISLQLNLIEMLAMLILKFLLEAFFDLLGLVDGESIAVISFTSVIRIESFLASIHGRVEMLRFSYRGVGKETLARWVVTMSCLRARSAIFEVHVISVSVLYIFVQ